jgi:flavin reductase (DIM6/NTAB) family NADH-FMN oxidoreductase RutF
MAKLASAVMSTPAAVPSGPADAGAGGIAPADFRRAVGRFATGVTIVSTTDDDGLRYGMTVNSFTSVSLEPLLVLFCCELDASIHAPLLRSGHWAVSVLRTSQVDLSRHFARSVDAGVDAWIGVDAVSGPASGDPVLPGSLAVMECRTVATYPAGDHTLLLGSVLRLEVGEAGDPLLYYDSHYRTTAPEAG